MLKMPITYEDLDDNTVTDDFYFNLTKLEMLEMEINTEGGLEAKMNGLIATNAGAEAYHLFKDIILSCYGKRSEDGKRFLKSPEIRAEFESSPAMSEMIVSFLQDPQAGAGFIEAVLPKKLVEEVKKEKAAAEAKKKLAEPPADHSDTPELETAAPVVSTSTDDEKKFDDYSQKELLDMSDEAFNQLVGPQKEWDTPRLQAAFLRKSR